jgi:hypothetical protein
MQLFHRLSLASRWSLASCLVLVPAAAAAQGTVTGLTMKPGEARTGIAITATATGSSPCGAVHIDWGDGTAITYATSTLPVTQSHVYQAGGSFVVRAQGMGNCAGQATARVSIAGPPPPPPPPPTERPAPPATERPVPRINRIDVSQVRGEGAGLRAIRVSGTGQCAYTIDFGDGNSEGRNAVLPDVVRHNYPAEGQYTITTTPAAPCTGAARSTVVVGDGPGGRVGRIEIERRTARPGQGIAMIVNGAGTCRLKVDLGDGRSREVTAALPHRFTHRYPEPGDYEVFVWTEAPCSGDASAMVRVRRR